MPVYETETRGKIRVPATKKENVKIWRDRKRAEGGRSLNIWIDKETVDRLELLLDRYPAKNKSELIAFAIEELSKRETPV